MGFAEGIRIDDGPVLWAVCAIGLVGAVYLLWPRSRKSTPARRTAAAALAAVGLAAALVLGVHWILVYGVFAFPDLLPPEVLAWSIPPVAALLLAVRSWIVGRGRPRPARRWTTTAAAAVAFTGVLALSAVQINAYFGLSHTVGDLTGSAVARIPSLKDPLKRQPGEPDPVSLARWTQPGALPAAGLIRKASIPGTVSGFRSRDAYIYLPPAYQATPRPALPVLVLFSGQPGNPSDWLTGGALQSRMDRFAAAHGGAAPVVVVVDPNGTPDGNTLCMDTRIARADTFLARDVPAWIHRTLDVDPDPRKWAAGGFSFGATCAIQMATRHPGVFSAALAFSSEQEPALAKVRRKTVEASFGGDTAAFDRQTPLQRMQQRRFDGNAIYFAAGERDAQFTKNMDVLSAAARSAGFSVATHVVPGAGHSWAVAARGLSAGLDFLAPRWGMKK